jgi:beta-glucosidase-like glycosyl hydrolase
VCHFRSLGQEVPGEDPFLNAEYILRYAPAFQFGADYDKSGLPVAQPRREQPFRSGHGDFRRNIATAKHFMDYDCEQCQPCNVTQMGDPNSGAGCSRQNFNALVPDRDQVEYYWPAFRAAVQGGDVASIMCSYNGVNGIPSVSKRRVVTS